MPADWEEIEGAEDEGVHIVPQGIPIKIHKDSKGRVKAVEYLKAEMVADEKGGRPRPVAIEGSNTIIEATAVMAAIGQMGDYSFLGKEFEDKIKIERGRFVVNEKQQTTDPKVFAGGDAVNRTADAISAIADGFRACNAIDELLMGKGK
jgi:glutamate synthase (NADPH/NADH) small chain